MAAGLGALFAVAEERVAVAGGAGSQTKLLGCGLEKGILDAQVIKRLAVLKVLGAQDAAVGFEGGGYDEGVIQESYRSFISSRVNLWPASMWLRRRISAR